MWEAMNTLSLAFDAPCVNRITCWCPALAMSSRVENHLPRIGSVSLGMRSKSQGEMSGEYGSQAMVVEITIKIWNEVVLNRMSGEFTFGLLHQVILLFAKGLPEARSLGADNTASYPTRSRSILDSCQDDIVAGFGNSHGLFHMEAPVSGTVVIRSLSPYH
ncbi:hypothetical protein TNCV_2361201 [Trichonephila clavipes]|nr:hypothetical protein TNCV_2361201 [Trichonephila clavipes]